MLAQGIASGGWFVGQGFARGRSADRYVEVKGLAEREAVESHLERLYVKDRGINGAFWANYLSAVHVGMAGGEQQIRAQLPGLRIERLDHGGLLVVATDSPLPDDTEDNRRRFLQVHAALQPAFLSREETSEQWAPMLGYFYRERESVIP